MAIGRVSAGSPEPLGLTLTETGANFAVVSTTAEAIDLCLFDADGREQRIRLPERTGEVFHGHIEGVCEDARYGLRAHGAFAPEKGLRFDPSKLLLDPYAVALDGPFQLHPALFAAPHEGIDSAPWMPKARAAAAPPPARPPVGVPWDLTVIYEAHVRGFTRRHPEAPEVLRGTFAALACGPVIAHLRDLGVTTLELMPAAAWVDERHLPKLGLTDYWGYNPVSFCAPDPRLAPGGWAEVRAATAALAEAGIEVVLDVVLNHTGEGDALGPTLSLRGLDNRGYYRLDPGDPARYVNDAGTGNTLALDRPQAVRLAMEALRTWVRRGGVSGFRFDLATVLGRRPGGFDPAAPLITAIRQDPELRALKLITEPWDCGPGGHQLGRFPAAFGEWNDRFRDTARRFWGGFGATRGELAARLAGSQDVFAEVGRPSRSINFVTAHDGFTLADLVSYAAKHNEANGEGGRDGADANWSWNDGAEGPSADPGVVARRAADQRALLATLLLARGTPMLSMGSEFGQSQGGNNNAYAQDNAASWLDWADADLALARFAARLTRARRDHAALRCDRFLTGEAADGPWPDVAWLDAEGLPLEPAAWDDPRGETLQMVLSAPAEDGLDRIAIIVHRGEAACGVRLPELRDRGAWNLLADSADPARAAPVGGDRLEVAPRSIVLLAETLTRRRPRGADDALVARVADAAGIAPSWWSLDEAEHRVSPETQRALLAAMGFPAGGADEARDSLWRLAAPERAPLPRCTVVREGEPIVLRVRGTERWLAVTDEDGRTRRIQAEPGRADLGALRSGRYGLRLGEAEGVLVVAPASAYEPAALATGARVFGVSAQLYALPRAGDQGVGDFSTLARLGEAAGREGASLLAINPLHMLFPQDRSRASPYHPSDRRFLDPIYLDLPEAETGGALGEPLIDYPTVWAAKAQALERTLAGPVRGAEAEAFDRFVREGGQALADFACFQAIAEAHPGRPWRDWPGGLSDPRSAATAAFAAAHAERVVFHQRLQWLCERQLGQAAARAPGLGLCRDLAVGAAGDGAEVWACQGRWAMGASIGAPPDAFAPQGQVWALPPPVPQAWRAEGYAGFAELLRANMRHAGALRIDHVLGLERLFWTPEGAAGADGAYVRYPREDLMGVLALESHRARCLVVGEDLGTVPEGFRDRLAEAGVYGYSVVPFEREGGRFRTPEAYRRKALACAATHDLPPLAGWWAGADLDERRRLGLLDEAGLAAARTERAAEKAALAEALGLAGEDSPESAHEAHAVAVAVHRFLARTRSQLVLVQAEDLAGEREAQNIPGTDRERPNWRRRIGTPVERLWDSALARGITEAVRAERALTFDRTTVFDADGPAVSR